uniref:Uncharacterized protein n=1 Tax=Anguilla anguilla TaxID=7936 RepID=A0A0E9WVL0_ANGAN
MATKGASCAVSDCTFKNKSLHQLPTNLTVQNLSLAHKFLFGQGTSP